MSVRHDFENDNVIMGRLIALLPKTLSGRSQICCDTIELARKLFLDLVELLLAGLTGFLP